LTTAIKPNGLLKVTGNEKRIASDMQVRNAWQDGVEMVLSEGSKIPLELNGNSSEVVRFMRVGGKKWPVEWFPVFLAKSQ